MYPTETHQKIFEAITAEGLLASKRYTLASEALEKMEPSNLSKFDINYSDQTIGTLLTYAIKHAVKTKYIGIINLLLIWDADIEKAVPLSGRWGVEDEKILAKVWHSAIETKDRDIIKSLLPYKFFFFFFAARTGDVEMMKRVLSYEVTNQSDNTGKTALDYAAFMGHTEIVKILLGAKVNPNKPNGNKMVPLAYAVNRRNVNTIIALLNGGAQASEALLGQENKAACLLMVAQSQFPRPFTAEVYTDQLIENLGSALLYRIVALRLESPHLARKKIPAEALYIIGADFINQLAGNRSQLPENFHIYLINQLELAEHEQCLLANLTPRSKISVDGYLHDYRLLVKALRKTDPELYKTLAKTDADVLKYCLTVLAAFNKNNNIKPEAHYKLAVRLKNYAITEKDPKKKYNYYEKALRHYHAAKLAEYHSEDFERLGRELKTGYLQLRSNASGQITASSQVLFAQSAESKTTPAPTTPSVSRSPRER